MDIMKISTFCDDTLGDVVSDLHSLKIFYIIEIDKTEDPEIRERDRRIMASIDRRIAQMKAFFADVRQELQVELASQKDL